jgi:hypothetical protein
MEDQPTCGKGLAAQSSLPAMLGDLIAAMADVLEVHQQALDLTDADARPEHRAYAALVVELRRAGGQLATIARQMIGYRDLPMGRHDEQKMGSREAVAAFEQFVKTERTLLSQLTATVGEHEAMLEQMR